MKIVRSVIFRGIVDVLLLHALYGPITIHRYRSVIVSLLVSNSNVTSIGFDPRSGQTNKYIIGMNE